MAVTSGLVLYAVLWFLALLIVLPFGVRSQEEAGEIEPGTSAGAPADPRIGRKMLWATLGAAAAWLVVFGVVAGGVITREDIRVLAPFD